MNEAFIKHIRYERNFSSHTVLSYINDLNQFEKFLLDSCVEVSGMDVADSDMVRNWIVELMNDGCKATTVARKVAALRTYYRYLMRCGMVSSNPAHHVVVPKLRKRLPYYVKPEQMDMLIDGDDFSSSFKGVRDRLLLTMLYSTGIRRSELIGLLDVDVDVYNATIKVLGKRSRERIIPFGNELKEMIEVYRESRSQEVLGKVSCFFVRNDGSPLYPGLVYRIVVASLSSVSSLEKRSPHVLRHSFASAMLSSGADLNGVKELLGHRSLASTQIYTHISIEDLKKSYKQAHPRGE